MAIGPDDRTATRRTQLVLLVAAAVLAGLALAWLLMRQTPAVEGLLQVNGRIEGDRVTVAPKFAGRVVELAVREGDVVMAGQVLARLDGRAVGARLDQALAAEASLRAQLEAQKFALGLLRAETALAVQAAGTRVAAAEADLRRAEAAHAQDGREHARATELSAQGFVGPQALERAALALRQSGELRDAARAAQGQAQQALRDAELGPQRVRAREAELAVTRARLQEAAAVAAEARSALEDLTLGAPVGGTVTGRFVNLGEVVNAGTPLLEVTDLGRLYLKAYLPETQVGRVRRGMPARIHVDAYPGEPFAATLRYVSARAEFTPKEVQTVDERVNLVYEVRLYVDQDPGGRVNPGQPADGMIRWRDGAAWQAPRH
ncbi:MAG: efflux RND transporter periplasmic adaptor subunit [Burkholderiales bacterium]|nr:efflux RND transporter periplasmic adaptor subunit [Burkholderiales bacterium]